MERYWEVQSLRYSRVVIIKLLLILSSRCFGKRTLVLWWCRRTTVCFFAAIMVSPSPVFSFCSRRCVFALYADSPLFLFQSGISMDTTGTTHLAGYSCTTGLRCGSIEVSSWGGLVKILSENLQEMFPYSCRKGHVPRRKSQKSFRIPNHPVKIEKLNVMIQA